MLRNRMAACKESSGRARAAELSMRHAWILSLPLALGLTACAATDAATTPTAGGPALDRAAPAISEQEGILLDARAEAEAAEREREFLETMARQGVYPVLQPAQASVKYHQEDVIFGLYNEAYTAQSEFYTVPRTSANFKVVANLDMGALWKSLEESDFFKLAQTGIVRLPGATVSVVMRRGEESWTLAWAPTMDKQRYEQTMQCANAVSALFNGTFGLQVIDNPSGVEYFEKERARLRQNANKTQNGLGGGQ